MSIHEKPVNRAPLTAEQFARRKRERGKLSMVTCYDYSSARLIERTDIDAILVGDSVAMVVHGHQHTLAATVEMIAAHTAAVSRGAPSKFLVADLPFLSYRKGRDALARAAEELMRAGAHALKLEGIRGHEDAVTFLVESGIPVMGHIGLTPQSIHALGGYRVQGRSDHEAAELLSQAKLLESLGCFSLVLECVPSALGAEISKTIEIPTIGIGAGAECDGQILVLHDLLGLNTDFRPRFVRVFEDTGTKVISALEQYDQAVKCGSFPSPMEGYQ